ncbi:hypothetical protein GCM10022261_21100 [Brevibacterium daeguense]|uniref:SGNH hydrolase-type esterase domain-containing protein n=1 Tax=Brevibacterium daeguense TaxID=909936 RepID=A0ABP8EKW2_9MICO|nr:GDSL-type esterase/lipase family protein [Brevibacterium daeguense]
MRTRPLLTAASATLGGALVAGGVHYGLSLRTIRRQSSEHPRFWASRIVADMPSQRSTLSYVALGDSAASGVGVDDPESGYVSRIEQRLGELSGQGVRTANLSVPGASTWLLLEDQLPLFEQLPEPDVVTCIIGGNDMIDPKFTIEGFEWTLVRLFPRLPRGTVVSTIPSFGLPPFEKKVRAANQLIRAYAHDHGLYLADLYSATYALWPIKYFFHVAGDFFHPNERGYRVWADAIWEAVARSFLDRRGAEAGEQPAARLAGASAGAQA